VSPTSHPLHNKPVLISPEVGWRSSADGPDEKQEFGILGGTRQTGGRGTFAEYIAVEARDVVPCPKHLLESKTGWEEAAALPLAALTAYRCASTCPTFAGPGSLLPFLPLEQLSSKLKFRRDTTFSSQVLEEASLYRPYNSQLPKERMST
jgi:hypothetical protein